MRGLDQVEVRSDVNATTMPLCGETELGTHQLDLKVDRRNAISDRRSTPVSFLFFDDSKKASRLLTGVDFPKHHACEAMTERLRRAQPDEEEHLIEVDDSYDEIVEAVSDVFDLIESDSS